MNDSEMPIAQMFVDLIEKAKASELEQIEEARKIEREREKVLRRANGIMNASEMFYGTDEEQEDPKLKAKVLASIDQLNKDVAETMRIRKEQEHATSEEDTFPDPPIT